MHEGCARGGIARVVSGSLDPNPKAGGGLEELRDAGVEVELATGEPAFWARAQNDAWRTWVSLRRPFVTYKAAVTLDGRVTVPGERWVSGEESRRLVHELRAASDAVAVGLGTVRADNPRLDARDVDAARQPRRLAFGQGPLPKDRSSSCSSGRSRMSWDDLPRRRGSVASARRRTHAGGIVLLRRPRGQADALRRPEALRSGPGPSLRPAGSARARAFGRPSCG